MASLSSEMLNGMKKRAISLSFPMLVLSDAYVPSKWFTLVQRVVKGPPSTLLCDNLTFSYKSAIKAAVAEVLMTYKDTVSTG